MKKLIQEKQAQYTDIIDLFQDKNASILYIQCNFFTDLGFTFVAFAPPLQAEEIISVSPAWKSFTSSDEHGLYHDLLNAVFTPRGDTVRHIIVPAKRGQVMVRDGQADIYTCTTTPQDHDIQLASLPMYESAFHAFFAKANVPNWDGPSSMTNKRLVWRLGYYYPETFPFPIQYSETPEGTEALARVLKGGADFYIDDKHLINESIAAHHQPINRDLYQIEPVGFRGYYPAFALSSKGYRLRQTFEERMRILADQGKLQAIYDKWGHPLPTVYRR